MKEKIVAIILDDELIEPLKESSILDAVQYIFLPNSDDILKQLSDKRTVDAIITTPNSDTGILSNLPFDIRKKWVHFSVMPSVGDVDGTVSATFLHNNGRDNRENKLFSIFTCAYKTTEEQVTRLYNSLLSQTYNNWNWWVLDDTPGEWDSPYEKINDPRLRIIKNSTNHGNIGFNKHVIAMACDGDYLVEVDHDDELISDCLACLKKAFENHPDSHFVYSDTLEMVGNHISVWYGKNFSYGQGYYREENVNGWNYKVAITAPSINAKSIRGIHAQPNHVRAWEKNFYHKIGGHNPELSVCDDMDLVVRTFLNTRITHINKVLYIQYEDGARNIASRNTQGKRFKIIQEVNSMLMQKYDKQIHERILELGFKDNAWDEKENRGDVFMGDFSPINYGYQEFL